MDDPSDIDVPLQFDEPRLDLDPNCPNCHGTGVMEDGDRALECICLLRQRVAYYLTPLYGPAIPWDPDFRAEPFIGKDILLENPAGLPERQYRRLAFRMIKSFLLVTGRRFSHRTVTPYDIVQLWLRNAHDGGLYELARRIDLVVILFGSDPKNSEYPSLLPWLIRQRQGRGLATWILSAVGLDTNEFKKNYGVALRDALRSCTDDGFARHPLRPEGT